MAENSVFSKQMANREVCDMVFVDYKTKKPFLVVDYANTSSKELTGETVYAFGGKGHPKKVSFSGDKSGTLTIETQIQTPKLWELITGGTKTTSTDVMKHVKVPVTSKTTVTLGTGVEIANQNSVWVYDSSDITNVENVYNLNIKATSFPKAFTVYGDTYMKTTDDDILPYLFKAYKAVPQSNMSLSFANNGDPGTVTITCDLMTDDDGNIIDLTLLPEEENQGE